MQEHIERLERLGLPVPVIESDREEDYAPDTEEMIIHEDITSPQAQEAIGIYDLAKAYDNFWHYRCVMNPRLTLREKVVPALGRAQASARSGMTFTPAVSPSCC